MISLKHLNKLLILAVFSIILISNIANGEDEPADIWKEQDNQKEEKNQNEEDDDITIESPILSDDINKIVIDLNKPFLGL